MVTTQEARATLHFRVLGTPAPQGSKRHVGNGVMVESSKLVGPWREAVKAAYLSRYGIREPISGPLQLSVTFDLPKPKSAPKRYILPAKRPDLDKLLRATMDALTDCGLWADDAQVVRVVADKQYAANCPPGAAIWVMELGS